MSRPYACDGPTCNTWYRTTPGFRKDYAALTVIPNEARSPDEHLHFCSWDCVLTYGMANTTRVEIVGGDA